MKKPILILTENKMHEHHLKQVLASMSPIFVKNSTFKEEKFSHLKLSFIIIDESVGKTEITSLITSIKENPDTKESPILVISNSIKVSYVEDLIHMGVSGFIPMPIAEEDIINILKDTNAHRSTDEIIRNLKIPAGERSAAPLSDHGIIPFEKVNKIKEALASGDPISLALIACKEKPHYRDDLLIQVTQSIYCLISIEKNTKQLHDYILESKSENLFAGIVSNEKKSYDDISIMINDAKNALARAKETPHGISFYTN